ncbi:NUDIX hydrolase [Chromatiales bacterium (ex Bugula neritina AB1)]|nr:NUDIX hydrolase [Chromatiales bacterium (ex Bugula neritina AB1)]
MVWKPHATVAAVIARGNSFLIVEEPKEEGVVFNQPAGHLEDGESLQQAIIREVREETAWAFTPKYILGIYRWRNPARGNTHMRTTFVGSVSDHHPEQKLFDNIISATWKTVEELNVLNTAGRLRSPLVLACINDYLSGQGYPLSLCRDI